MKRDIALLVMISGLSFGALLSTCFGASSPGSEPNQAASQTATADSNRPADAEKAVAQNQKPSKLLGWWKLDEADGNSVADASGNGRAGTRMGNPQWRPEGGKIGGALDFDGDGDRIEISDKSAFDVTEAITVAAWIKVKTFDRRWQAIVTKGDSAWRLQRTAEENTLAFHCTGIRSADADWPMGVAGRKNINDGQWHHAVGVYDGTTASLYIDGVLDDSSPASGSIQTNDFAVVIGGNSEVSSREWNGLIDEVCILARAIDANEVRALYIRTRAQHLGRLIAWWRLDDGTSDSVADVPGTPVGNLTYVPGKSGQALNLDGAACVDCGMQDSLDFGERDWAIAAWIRTTQAGIEPTSKGTIFANGADELGGIRYTLAVNEVDSNRVTLTTDDDLMKAQVTGGTPVTDGAWHHVVGTREGNVLRIYVDGALDGTSELPGGYDLSGASRQNAYIGAIKDNRDGSLYKYFIGQIDEVCVFASALGDSRVKALYSGTDPMMVASSLRDETTEMDAAAEPAKTTRGKWWLALAAIVVATGLIVWAFRLMGAPSTNRKDLRGSLRHLSRGAPGMTWKIARKEFLLNLMTFKFAATTIVCVVLTAVFTPILAKDYQQRLNAYRENVARNDAEMSDIKVYEHLKPTIFRPPAPLSIFSQGLEKQFVDSVKVVYNEVPEISVAAANHYLSIFPVFDASLLFKIVMSILALLVAYDTISGEREQGTLRLMLSGTTARYQVLLGKLLAGLMVVAVPTAVTFIVGLLILLSFPMVNLAGSDWMRIGFMFLASLLFVGTMYTLGLLFSSVAGRSAISLVLGLFFWVLFVLVIPNASIYVASQLRQLAREDQLNEQIATLRREAEREFVKEYKLSGRSVSPGESSVNHMPDAFGRIYTRWCSKPSMEGSLIRYAVDAPLEIKYAQKQWEVKYNGYLRGLFEQRRLAGDLARVSPISLYENVMSALAGTDMASFQQFIEGVRTYRNDVIEYLRLKTDNFSLPCFFTPCTEEESMMESRNDEPPSLEVSDAPRFRDTRHTTANLRRAFPDLGLLAAVNLFLLGLSLVAFARYDVR